jgi:hypothetical protein
MVKDVKEGLLIEQLMGAEQAIFWEEISVATFYWVINRKRGSWAESEHNAVRKCISDSEESGSTRERGKMGGSVYAPHVYWILR